MSLIQSIVTQDEDNEQASSLGSSHAPDEANNQDRPESPIVNGEDEQGEEEDSEARPLIRHRSRPVSRGGTSPEPQAEAAEDCSTSLSSSDAQKMQRLVKKLQLQVGPISALRLEGWTSSIRQVFLGAGLGGLTVLLVLVHPFPRCGQP